MKRGTCPGVQPTEIPSEVERVIERLRILIGAGQWSIATRVFLEERERAVGKPGVQGRRADEVEDLGRLAIADLPGVGERLVAGLERMGVLFVADLEGLSEAELRRTKNVGPKLVEQLKTALNTVRAEVRR